MSEEQHSPSLREALEAASNPAPETTAAPEAAPAQEQPGQARDEAGRFAPATPAEASTEEDDYDESVGLDRETWKLTPAQARERAKVLAKERAEYEGRVKAFEPLDRVLAPRRDALRAAWGDEGRAVENLLHLSDWAGRDFPGFVKHLAQQQGYDLRSLVPQPQAAPQPQGYAEAPDVNALIEQKLAEREALRSLAEFENNTSREFRSDEQVRRAMAGLIQSGVAADIPTAYEMAVKAIPSVAAKLAERESAERAKRDAEDRARRAREAASASVSVTGSPGTAKPADTRSASSTIRDDLMRAMEMAGGRV
jgi:hypothetical protein